MTVRFSLSIFLTPLALTTLLWPVSSTFAESSVESSAEPTLESSPTGQTADSAEAELETMVVTAHRLPTARGTLPVVQRYRGSESALAPAAGGEGLRDLPSFALSTAGNLGSLSQAYVRGGEANHLMVLMDGVEVGDPAAAGGDFNFANLPFADVVNVEYLAGAQSAIWGSDALAGVLHLSTEPDSSARTAWWEHGSFDTQSIHAELADRNTLGFYRFSYSDFRTDGTNVARTGTEQDGFDQRTLAASVGKRLGSASVKGFLRTVRADVDYDPTPFPAFLPSDGDNQTRHHALLAGVTLTTPLPWAGAHLSNTTQLSFLETENGNFEQGASILDQTGARKKASNVLRWSPDARRRLEMLVEMEQESFDQAAPISFFGDPNQHQEIRTVSAALEWVQQLSDRWELAVSTRFDSNDSFDDAGNWRLGLNYRPAPAWQLWANLGTGRKNPTFIELYGFAPENFLGNQDLKPEENRHLSLGAIWQHGAFKVAATAFRDRLEDEIVTTFDLDLGVSSAGNRADTSSRDGVELEMTALLGDVTLTLAGSWLDAEEADGNREIRRPGRQGHLTVAQRRGRLGWGTGLYYVGAHRDIDFAVFQRVTLNDYLLGRVWLRYDVSARWQVAARIENLLDEHYEDQLGYRPPPRAAYLRLGLSL